MKIETDDLTITYDVKTCIHARRCVLGLPKVFDTDADPWIQPQHAATEAIVDVIRDCPSGALGYVRKDGVEEATKPLINTVRLWEKGPVEVRGDVRIKGQEPRTRALLCRCGLTTNPPFCNNNHRGAFDATGLPGARDDKDEPLEARDGPLEIEVYEDGPMGFHGNFEMIGSDGSRIARMKRATLCRCGASGDKPFCNGNHKKTGFTKPTGAAD